MEAVVSGSGGHGQTRGILLEGERWETDRPRANERSGNRYPVFMALAVPWSSTGAGGVMVKLQGPCVLGEMKGGQIALTC